MVKHWRMRANDKQQWRRACLEANHGCCPLCQGPLKFEHSVSDHCHATGITRAALCKRCNGALILGAIENAGMGDEAIAQLNKSPGKYARRPWQRDYALTVVRRARAYSAAWVKLGTAHQQWRRDWGLEEDHTVKTAPNRFVLASWVAMVANALHRDPTLGRDLGLGRDPLRALMLAGAARYLDKADGIQITKSPDGTLRLTAPPRLTVHG